MASIYRLFVKPIFLFLICFISLNISAQSYIEYVNAEIHFLDNTKKEGLALVKPSSDKISFKESKKEKRVKYNHYDVARLILKRDTIFREFRYKKSPDRRAPRLLQVVIDNDDVSLYATFTKYKPGGLIGAIFNIEETDYIYYLVKNQSKDAIYVGEKGLTSRKRMSKVIKKHLGDCPDLVKKANEKEFRLKDIKQIVEYYNSNCSK